MLGDALDVGNQAEYPRTQGFSDWSCMHPTFELALNRQSLEPGAVFSKLQIQSTPISCYSALRRPARETAAGPASF
jgi:hypothetical protein